MSEAAALVQSRSPLKPSVGIVLGSGLGAFADFLDNPVRIAYEEIPGFPLSTAIGHKGELVVGQLSGISVIVMAGRFHLYEGYSAQQVVCGIRLFKQLGVRRVVLNQCGRRHRSGLRRGSVGSNL